LALQSPNAGAGWPRFALPYEQNKGNRSLYGRDASLLPPSLSYPPGEIWTAREDLEHLCACDSKPITLYRA